MFNLTPQTTVSDDFISAVNCGMSRSPPLIDRLHGVWRGAGRVGDGLLSLGDDLLGDGQYVISCIFKGFIGKSP